MIGHADKVGETPARKVDDLHEMRNYFAPAEQSVSKLEGVSFIDELSNFWGVKPSWGKKEDAKKNCKTNWNLISLFVQL